ncbi:MAG: diguanylate cyclase [Rhodocyclales bacterium]|nr:diguanylate cyclase [Rhodocyclales bacterium]
MLEHAGYRLTERLHDDRQTRVYRARRVADDFPVVLKILADDQPLSEAIPRYRREYEVTRSLGGIEGVIKVYDLVNVQNSLMIVEEDIGAESLDRLLAKELPNLAQALEIAVRIAHILGEIHQHNVIHKDLNPANVIWNRDSGELRVIDFGIASQLTQEQQEFQSPGQLEGTLAYTSPEQTGRVNRKLDYRSDLYSFGVTLYELLSGILPFSSREGIELVHAHIAVTPPPPHQVNPRVPLALSQIVMRLIEKMADDRYQSAWGVKHDLERCRAELRGAGSIAPFPLGEGDVPARFHVPQRLYGRAQEVAAIIAVFDRAADGAAELLLVKGSPGVGKSALVHEVHKPLTERRGNFVSGKFDQYQRDVPFYAWTLAFQDLCHLLLQEDEDALAQWRARILADVGNLGRVLTDVVPSIELIIGAQPEVPPLAGEQALNRLNYVFGNFIKAISTPEHPLVIFIDDWQWADSGSLSLLRFVLGSSRSDNLLVICSYRDNEVDCAHPLHAALADIGRSGTEIGTIHLQNLGSDDVRQLIGDALGDAPGLQDLARLLYEKTQGNAFFLVQLLNDLHERAAISFDRAKRCWTWQQALIEAAGIADNVVELMAERIRSLPAATERALINAACIGDRFQLAMLARMLDRPAHLVADDLDLALQEGIIIPLGSGYRFARQKGNTAAAHYQFVHDRVRQAAYGLAGSEASERMHYDIARMWLDGASPDEQDRNIFDIANQYNAGRRLIDGPRQRNELLDINLRAGKRARLAADHASALNYFQTALELRSERCWRDQPKQTAELFLLAADAAFLCKDYAAMEAWLDDHLTHVESLLERVAALKIRLQAYVAQNRLAEAVDVGLHALQLLGTWLPKSPGKLRVAARLIETRLAIKRKSFTDLYVLPEMTDPYRLETMELLGLLLPPAYWTSQGLLALVVFQMVRETLTHGYSPNAGYGLSWWGITESAMLGNIDAGAVFGEFAVELARKHQLKLQQPLFFAGWIIHKYKHPLRESLPLLEQAYAVSLEKGDFEYASYARNNQMQLLFHSGTCLGDLLPEMARAHRDLLRYQVGSSLYWHDIWWQAAQNFVSGPTPVDVLAGPAYDETVSLPQHLKVNDHSTLFLLHCAKLMLAVFFNDVGQALTHAGSARRSLTGGTGMHAETLFHFYESLALLADAEGKRYQYHLRFLQRIADNQKKLARWAEHAPTNHRHHWCLVEAERLRVIGNTEGATSHYEMAIDLAREGGFLHEEALACELAARFQRRQRRERLAAYYLRQALHLYERWGASGKVDQLRAQFPMLLLTVSQGPGPRSAAPHRSSVQRGEAFDLEAVTQASQAISSEIVIDNLIKTLLRIVIAHSGAQRAVLILRYESGLRIEATGIADETVEVGVEAIPVDERENLPLPKTLIQYVGRTLKSMVIDDARAQTPFSRDPYFLRERPVSVLCEPILQQGKLVGMLYLENNLTAGAFTEERLELLRLLSAQAAISIENARLYGRLEQKVEERTQKLQDSLATQEQLNAELQASSIKLEAAYAQLHAANRLLEERANTDGLTGLANRRYFGERLEYELGRCAREQQPLSLIICDLDNFKRYNDLYGHVSGDECLRQAAATIKSVFSRTTDLVARYGGEEFVVLLPATDSAEAVGMGERMRGAVAELGIEHVGNADFGIATISVGCYTLTPSLGTPHEAVIENADRALYAAKDRGRNCLASLQ